MRRRWLREVSRNHVFFAGILVLVLLARADAPAQAQSLTQRLRAESAASLASDSREKGNAVRGAILLTQQNLSCTRCHAAGVANPVGPDLTRLGSDVTDVSLVESLLLPSKAIRKGFESVTVLTTAGKTYSGRIVDESPERIIMQLASGDLQRVTLPRTEIEEFAPNNVSTMPDNLVDQLTSRDQFLDLVRYLMELAAQAPTRAIHNHPAGGHHIGPELQGMVLLKEFNCAACHQDDVTNTRLAVKQPPDLLPSAGRINSHFMQKFIANPLHTRPGTTMPDVMSGLTADERQVAAEEITHYLASLSNQTFEIQPIDSVAAARGYELFHSVGCVACHSPRDDSHSELLPESSVPLGTVQEKYNLDGLVAFLRDPLEKRPSGRMPKMQLTHFEAVEVASYLLSEQQNDLAVKPFDSAGELAAKGKTRFGQLGCRQCHRLDGSDAGPLSQPLSQVRPDRGCLSEVNGRWPTFGFKSEQRNAIRAALKRQSQPLSENDQLAVTLTAFRCLNCHQRDDLGGVSSERDSYFQTTNQNLGPQGRIPPTLTGVGAKINPVWMRQVLVSGRTIRPYVLTRMPQFGTENIEHVVDLFRQTDSLPPSDFAEFNDLKPMKEAGATMAGTGGLNCIVCHTFQLQEAANMPAVDLTEMAERLQKNWFYHYMRDPQRFSQNTIMPSFWPGGRAMRSDILDGNRDLQIEALWQYLLEGRQARPPRGLIQEPLELLATDQAVMLRRSYPEIGKRGIGVGYPGQVNLAFDAEQMRLAMIWKGKFADPAGVWRSQGHGRVRPLGDNLIQFAPGPDLDNPENPWTVDEGRPPQHHFKGYSLDEKMRPRFRYEFAGINVEDYVVDVPDASTGRPFLRRTITLKPDKGPGQSTLTFRAATGKSIGRSDGGDFLVDDRLRVRIPEEHTGTITDASEFKELRIPLIVKEGSASLTLEYRW